MCHAATRAAVLVAVVASSLVACSSGELAAPGAPHFTDSERLSVSISVDRDSIAYGAERQYSASVQNQWNEPRPASVAWSSTNPSVVTVSAGRVRAVGAGSAQIVAAIPGHADTALISVYGVISKLAVVPEVVLIPEGEELRFQADVGQVPGSATSYVHWATTDSLVAKVKDDGTLTAVSAGSAELVATYGSTVGRAAVRVFTSPVASITIKPGASNLAAGSTVKLDAQLWDANSRRLMGRQILWSSSSESLARVDANGVVTGVSKGVAYITAESEGKRSSAAMVVGPRPVSSVSVSIASATLSVMQMTQVTATVLDAAGQAIPPSEQPVFWQSANPTIANVTGAGVVFAVAVGRTTISALAGGKTASVEVEVVNRQAQSVVIVPANPSVLQGAAVQLAAEVRDQNGVAMPGMSVTWSSGNPAVATITSSGMVTGVASGTAQITATSGSLKGTATLTVSGVPVASVSISPSSLALDPGAASTMTATPRDASGQPLSGRVITWSSSNPTVATVSSTGKVTAVAVGTVSVTATSEGKSAQASVTVNQPAPAPVATVSVSLNSPSLLPGQTTQARATLFDANGRLLTERVVTWSSSDPALATVSATGLVTGKSAGTVTIIATSEGKSGAASLTIELTAPAPVATVTLTLSPKSIQAGQTAQASVTLKDAQGNTLTGRTVGYSSSNSGVAAVSASGTVTGKSAGSAAILATSEGKTGADTATVSGGTPVATRVSVTATKPSINVGQVGDVVATVYDQAGNVMSGVAVTWSSSNSSVVRTSASSEYFAVASGTATITGTTSNGVSGGIGITVLGSTTTVAPVATVSVSLTSPSLLVGQTTQAVATLKDANGNVLSGRLIAWSSSNGAVATVTQSGVVTAVGAGTAQIVAASEGKSGVASETVTAPTVPAPPPSGGTADTALITRLMGPMLPSATVASLGGVFARYEADFVKFDDAQWASECGALPTVQASNCNYYDRAMIYYVWWKRTGNAKYRSRADATALNFRTGYLEPTVYNIAGWWQMMDGIGLHALLNNDAASLAAVGHIADIQAYLVKSGSDYFDNPTRMDNRGQAYALKSLLVAYLTNAPSVGNAPPNAVPGGNDWATELRRTLSVILGTRDADGQWRGAHCYSGTMHTTHPFMIGLLYDNLIRYYEQFEKDPRILPAIKQSADLLWANEWIPASQAFKYVGAPCPEEGNPTPAADLNNLIVNGYAWLYKMTGDAGYKTKADAIFAGGVNSGATYLIKQFNQNYTSSYRYLSWR